jgi:hypothetical protein
MKKETYKTYCLYCTECSAVFFESETNTETALQSTVGIFCLCLHSIQLQYSQRKKDKLLVFPV